MPALDLQYFFQWWVVLFLVGLVFFHIASTLLHSFFDKGYLFSKVIGIVSVSYVAYVLGTLKIAPFTEITILVSGLLVPVAFYYFTKHPTFSFSKTLLLLITFEEIIFISTLLAWSYIRAHQPDITGLEKYMDFGFVNSILRTEYFPAVDMWLTPFSINYYYFGHLITAVLTKLSYVPSNISYNLMIATLFAFAFSLSFSISLNMLSSIFSPIKSMRKLFLIIIGGFLGGYLVSLSGNIHTIYAFFQSYQNENPVPVWDLSFLPNLFPNTYWYPNATRFIYNTIHEFPNYSFVVSDLHGHVLGIPIILTIVAILFHDFTTKTHFSIKKTLLLSYLIATAYMTNALDGPIYLLLVGAVLFVQSYMLHRKLVEAGRKILLHLGILVGGFIIFTLPFSLHFNSFVSGIGILCAPDFLLSLEKIGPFLFEPDHCQRSPLWQLFILHGFFWIWGIVLLLKVFYSKASKTDLFAATLFLMGFFLIILPEFIYFKDIYPAHYRANTMFKLGYQSFMLSSLVVSYSIIRMLLGSRKKVSLYIVGILALGLVMLYPYFSINSYYGNLKEYKGLDGTTYLKKIYPTDYEAIQWINKTINNQPVILEAQGDSYTDFARISTNTGLPTVLGWTVHEWLWRGSYSIPSPRINDVKELYESNDMEQTKKLLKQYNVTYVFIGALELQKYPDLNEEKFKILGASVYNNQTTRIYKIR